LAIHGDAARYGRACAAAACAAIAFACTDPPPLPPLPLDEVYDLAHHLDGVQKVDPGGMGLELQWHELGFDGRTALLQHPPSRMRFPAVPSGAEASLHLAPALLSDDAGRSDGARFVASCRDAADGVVELLAVDLAPEMARRWHDRKVALSRCSAPTTDLELRTTCGSASCASDWALWGDPHIRWVEYLAIRRPALVLLISVDTLRADRLGLYGGPRPVSPHLNALASDGIVFKTVLAPSPWTIPSHASLLTSSHPQRHLAHEAPGISPSLPTLAEVLRNAGWDTAGFVDSPFLVGYGFPRGFQHYEGDPPPGVPRRGARQTRAGVLRWLAQPSARPAFVFWHIMDVHGPYQARAPFGGRFRETLEVPVSAYPPLSSFADLGAHAYLGLDRFRHVEDLIAAYDEGIAAADAEIGAALQFLRDAGVYDRALIIVTSDHGEDFYDRETWLGHGLFLHEAEIRVPLIVKLPGNRRAGERVRRMTRLIDVAPTILDVVEIDAPATFAGRALTRPPPREGDTAVGISTNTGAVYVRTDEWKYVSAWRVPLHEVAAQNLLPAQGVSLERFDTSEQLWSLASDPGERQNLIAAPKWAAQRDELRSVAEEMIRLEAATREVRRELQDPALTADQVRALQALGYFLSPSPVGQGTTSSAAPPTPGH